MLISKRSEPKLSQVHLKKSMSETLNLIGFSWGSLLNSFLEINMTLVRTQISPIRRKSQVKTKRAEQLEQGSEFHGISACGGGLGTVASKGGQYEEYLDVGTREDKGGS